MKLYENPFNYPGVTCTVLYCTVLYVRIDGQTKIVKGVLRGAGVWGGDGGGG